VKLQMCEIGNMKCEIKMQKLIAVSNPPLKAHVVYSVNENVSQ